MGHTGRRRGDATVLSRIDRTSPVACHTQKALDLYIFR